MVEIPSFVAVNQRPYRGQNMTDQFTLETHLIEVQTLSDTLQELLDARRTPGNAPPNLIADQLFESIRRMQEEFYHA